MCTDRPGNVWVTNTNNLTLDEYTPGGEYVATLRDAGGFPVGCAVSQKGTLIAANIFNAQESAPGNIQVYTDESGSGTTVQTQDAGVNRAFFVGFVDTSEQAWISGENASYNASLAAYRAGTPAPIVLSGATIGFPGTVTYSKRTKTMVVGDQSTFSGPTFYEVDAKTHVVSGTTVLGCTTGSCDFGQVVIDGGHLYAATSSEILTYAFPAGGPPIKTVRLGFPGSSSIAISRIR
jgi:hypothetical protein